MKKFLFAAGLIGMSINFAYAGDSKVNWGNLDKFTDVQEGRDQREYFRENLKKEFSEIFNGLAKKLPEGYTLTVNVNDLDLAGDIRPSISYWQIRIMTTIYWPRMSFDYELKNDKNEVVASGKEELRDMDYLNRIRIPSGRTQFEYEEKMIQDWFRHQYAVGNFPSRDVKAVAGNH
ncbi:DUF3016 domain-containing protein [Undibacterium cyanobacteriorum]|uniref:DUF3016 domain-containing protein n=1 Tax=Undibacterium cyanobacteriorum TaxID=3073561 RepID=A0ABY9REZ9_9BURK|nr:DUF3016 domain-containing protein [Undibacterium sp. 20NA77.5]WMW79414.1 DUF3016 domain-containing protein [Undibacterium sp. 20NA77.5]